MFGMSSELLSGASWLQADGFVVIATQSLNWGQSALNCKLEKLNFFGDKGN